MSFDDIWNEDAEVSVVPRSHLTNDDAEDQRLFLTDDVDLAANEPIEVTNAFEGLDDEEEEFGLGDLPDAVNVEALKKAAVGRERALDAQKAAAKAAEAKSSAAAAAKKPFNKRGKAKGTDGDEASEGEEGDEEGSTTKPRRSMPKLDEERLLGPNGFPALIKTMKQFKVKGKGHEKADLGRLLQMYQFWGHNMYPKMQFNDTVDRVERLCRSRRLAVSLSVWRDQDAKGIAPGTAAPELDDDEVEVVEDGFNGTRQSSPSRRASSPDSESAAAAVPRAKPRRGVVLEEDDDEEDEWNALMNGLGAKKATQEGEKNNAVVPARVPSKPVVFSEPHEDDEMWDELMADAPANELPMAATSRPAQDDMDQDMQWDIMDEIEAQLNTSTKQATHVTNTTPGPPSSTVTHPTQPPPAAPIWDDDDDDLYM